MTTNAVAADLARRPLASRATSGKATITRRSIASSRRVPQRLDAIVSFAHLNADVIGMVVEKFVLQLERSSPTATSPSNCRSRPRSGCAACYDEQMGARPMARVIQEHIKKRWRMRCCSEAQGGGTFASYW